MTAGYVIYITLFLEGQTLPNATSWTLWALGGAIEAWSFYKVIQVGTERQRQLPFLLPPLVCAVFALIVASIGIGLGKWEWPDNWEVVIAAVDISVVVAYFVIKKLTGERAKAARLANLLMILDILLSFVPILVTTWLVPTDERALPWLIWAFSYALLGIIGWAQIHHQWKERRWLIIYPFTSAIFHGAIGVIVLAKIGA